jgi:hypothetical protein
MEMGRRPGTVVYHMHAAKTGGRDRIPAHLLSYMEKNAPDFLEPVMEWSEPALNEESWGNYIATG